MPTFSIFDSSDNQRSISSAQGKGVIVGDAGGAFRLGSDLPSIPSIMNPDITLDINTLNIKKNQLLIKLKNEEITKSQYNQLISQLETRPIFGTNSIIPDNIQNLFNNPKVLTQPTIRTLVSLKPILVEKQEVKKAKNLIKLVSVKTETLNLDIYDKSFSPRLLNWVEPYDIAGINKTLFYTDVNSGLKVGDRVFIVNGNYDNDLLISIDKYKKGRDGYKVLFVDYCKIVLDINFTGVLPYNDDELDEFIKVYYIKDRQEFLQINRHLTTRDGVLDYKFNKYQNTIAYFDDVYSPVINGWGDNNGIPSPGFYVRDGSTSPASWIDITSNFISGSFSLALSPTYENNNRFKVLNGTFEYNNKTYQESFIYKWNIGPTQSDWSVDVTYHKPIITKSNFRDGIFNGLWNTGLFGRQNKKIIWDGNGSRWQTGTLLNTDWKKGTFQSRYTTIESYFSDFDENGIPFQKSNLPNNNDRGFNYIIDSTLESSSILNGTIINTIFGSQAATFSSVENHLISATTSYSNNIKKAYFESSYLNDMLIDNSEISNSRVYNSKILRTKVVNSQIKESIIKDSTFISDNIIKIEDYDEWSASEYGPVTGTSNKIYKFYITKKNYERLKNKDYFYIKGLSFNNSSKEVLNFFDKKFTLSSWTDYTEDFNNSNQFYKRPLEYTAYLSTPLENQYKVTTVGIGIGTSYSTAIVSENEKSQYSVDIVIKTIDALGYSFSGINFNRDTATSSPLSPTMSNRLGNVLDIKNGYLIDSEMESGIVETSNWINGNNINANNDFNMTIPSIEGGFYNMTLGSTTSRTLNVNLTYDYTNSELDDSSVGVGSTVYLNSVYHQIDNYITDLRIIDGGTNYTTQSNISTTGITGSGLVVNIDSSMGTVSNIYIVEPGTNFTIGSTVSIDDGDFNAVLEVLSVTSSLTLLPNDYKVLTNNLSGNIEIQEISIPGTSSVFDNLKPGGIFYTPDAQNRYGYIYKSKFYKTKIKSGIFRRSLFINSLIENDEYNVEDKDYTNLIRIRNLVVADGLFKNNRNVLSNATYLYSHFANGDNFWTNGIIQKSIWNGLTFSNGVIKESRWVNGIFNSGIFYESRTFNADPSVYENNYYTENTISYYKDGYTSATISNDRYSWQNGIFRLGTRNKNSEFFKSDWESGTFSNGKFYYSKWYSGKIDGGVFGDKKNDVADTMVYNATISDVIVENASFYASDTSWEKSTTNQIIWLNGIFEDGIFGSDYQQSTASNTAIWYNGDFNGGQFISLAKWKKGNFNGGKFVSGLGWTQSQSASQSQYTWEDGVFNGGEFGNGEGLTNSTWWTGQFNGGLFKGRVWNSGIFKKGEFQGSSTYPSVGGLSSSNAKLFVESFTGSFYGLWRDGYFTDQIDKLIKDKKLWTKVDRVEASEQRRSYAPSKISNSLWLNGTFSHQSGETNNIVWLNGTFDQGKFYNSSFNPYVRRSSNSYNVWSFSEESNILVENWQGQGTTTSTNFIGIISGEIKYLSTIGSSRYILDSSSTVTPGQYEITFDIKTFSTNSNLGLFARIGDLASGITYSLITGITNSNIGINSRVIDINNTGNFGLLVNGRGLSSSIVIDDVVVKRSPTASFNVDDSCIWTDGFFENGDFYISNWEKGKFIIGTGFGMIWKDGTSNYMNAFNIFWENGLWRNGNWYGSSFEFDGSVTDDFTKQILFRGMSWSDSSYCHVWNIFEDRTSQSISLTNVANDPLTDSSIDAIIFNPPPPPPTTSTTIAPEL